MMLIVGALVAASCSGSDAGDEETQTVIDAPVEGRPGDLTEPGEGSGDREPAADGDAGDSSASENQGGGDSPTGESYPTITEEIAPAEGGVKALITSTGVLVGVAGTTSNGYVVETPCGNQTELAWGQPITSAQVVLDPGHGGNEPGADDVPGLSEAELNLRVARRTAAILADRSISVVMTRNADYRITVRQRAALADRIQPTIFVSIHHNSPGSAPSPTPGTEVYVQSKSEQSRRLGGLLYEEVFDALSEFDVEWSSRIDAGVLVVLNDEGEDAYGIARYPVTTSALIEVAYLGNPKEAALMATTDYVDATAEAVADGIERYLTSEEPGSGFVETPRVFNPSGVTGGASDCVDPALQ